MVPKNSIHSDLKIIKELAYDKCDLALSNLLYSSESVEYGACSFKLNGHLVEHRSSKITPKKTGQFVAIWKRNENGLTQPFSSSDKIDFLLITSKSEDRMGQFIFPKSVLIDKDVFSHQEEGGKRGLRVYPPWDVATSALAEKTQSWQMKYFVMISREPSLNCRLLRKMFEMKVLD